jgi:hypothetical protein
MSHLMKIEDADIALYRREKKRHNELSNRAKTPETEAFHDMMVNEYYVMIGGWWSLNGLRFKYQEK